MPAGLDPSQPRPRLAFSPDGKHLVLAFPDRLELWDGDARTRIASRPTDAADRLLALAFDEGRMLWTCGMAGRVRSWSLLDLTPGQPRELAPEADGSVTAAAFDAQAARLAVGFANGRVRIHERAGKVLREFPPARTEVEALGWSPDGLLLAVGMRDAAIQLWDVQTGSPSHRLWHVGPGVAEIRFSPDGRRLVAGARGSMMVMWDVASGDELLTGAATPFGFSHDGHRLAVGSTGEVGWVDLVLPQAVRRLTGHRAQVARLFWSADGLSLASLDDGFEAQVWDVTEGKAKDKVQLPAGPFYAENAAVALGPDGRYLAYAGGRQALLRDVKSRQTLGPWPLPEGYDRLAPLGNDQFVLVREELETGAVSQRSSVVYHLSRNGLSQRRVLRPGRPGETGFFTHWLTLDGRRYGWLGPRNPETAGRAEVFDVGTGNKVVPDVASNQNGYLSSCGRYLWLDASGKVDCLDLANGGKTTRWPWPPAAVSPDARWVIRTRESPGELEGNVLQLIPWGQERPWLAFAGGELHSINLTGIGFRGDGRLLAWATRKGVIIVADLEEIRREVEQFERTVLPR